MNYVHFVATSISIMPKINCLAPVASLKCIVTLSSEYLPRSHDYIFIYFVLCTPTALVWTLNMFTCGLALRTLDFCFNSSESFSVWETNAANSIIADSKYCHSLETPEALTSHIISNIWDFITCPVCNFIIWVWKLVWGEGVSCITQPLEFTVVNSILVVSERNAKKRVGET